MVPRNLTGSWAYIAWGKKSMTVQNSDIIANDASFANALSNVEPHQHFCGHQSIPKCILWGNKFDLFAYSI